MDYSKYITVPFKELGRDTRGWDCWGIYRHLYHEFKGVLLPEFSTCYAEQGIRLSRKSIGEEVKQQTSDSWCQVSAPKESDAVVVRLRALPIHIAYSLGGTRFIHCCRKGGTTIEDYTRMLWKHRVEGFYRYE